ncbi:MAG: phenylalanine--tRNA ligase subunit beta [Planctomycetes bacterium]|nr:phenylalanine--tRNA ligase subunit beta [Planctomycetota bacterium]
MKLPILWLRDYLDANDRQLAEAIADACARWELNPSHDPAHTLGTLFTFAGFNCDGVAGSGWNAVLELDVLSNRPDCLCVLGLAREAAAFLKLPTLAPAFQIAESGADASTWAQMTVEDAKTCPRYTARVIRGVKVGPSPQWLQDRLKAMGLTPRNNIVDITNFILFELNHPLHAFDLNKLAGKRIVVRRAKDKEPFKPLYDELPPLTPETLVIADGEKPVAIGGIIGGAGSEVSPATTDILLEAACFDPASIRRSCRRLKAGTDSSYRFERGVDILGVERASARAARLIAELAGGTIAKGSLDSNPHPAPLKELSLRHERLNALYGVNVAPQETSALLAALGCAILRETAAELTVLPPTWRRHDLAREVDLIEEVARLHGYNHVPAVTSMSARIPPRSPAEAAIDRVREHFSALGYFECTTDSLIDPKAPMPAVWTGEPPLALNKQSVLREDHSSLRNCLLVSLLNTQRLNQDRRTGIVRLFECGKVFLPKAGQARPEERQVLGLLDETGFAALADAVRRLHEALSLDGAHLKLVPPEPGYTPAFLAPESACRVVRVREMPGDERAEDAIGWLGIASAALCKAFDLKRAPAVAEIHLATLATLPSGPRRYVPLPTQPENARDVALVVDESVAWQEIERFTEKYKNLEPLRDKREATRFLSVFRGKQLGAGKKSVAFSVVYRAADRSLTDEEVNTAHRRFVDELLKTFNAALRA